MMEDKILGAFGPAALSLLSAAALVYYLKKEQAEVSLAWKRIRFSEFLLSLLWVRDHLRPEDEDSGSARHADSQADSELTRYVYRTGAVVRWLRDVNQEKMDDFLSAIARFFKEHKTVISNAIDAGLLSRSGDSRRALKSFSIVENALKVLATMKFDEAVDGIFNFEKAKPREEFLSKMKADEFGVLRLTPPSDDVCRSAKRSLLDMNARLYELYLAPENLSSVGLRILLAPPKDKLSPCHVTRLTMRYLYSSKNPADMVRVIGTELGKKLVFLDLSYMQECSREVARQLGNALFPKLTELRLDNCGLKADVLAILTERTGLKILSVAGNPGVSSPSSSPPRLANGIVSLDVTRCALTDTGFKTLISQCHSLETISAGYNRLTDAACSVLEQITGLKTLNLARNPLTCESVYRLTDSLRSLVSLNIFGLSLDKKAVRSISTLTALEELVISGDIGQDGMAKLSSLSKLRSLQLEPSDAEGEHAFRDLKQFKTISDSVTIRDLGVSLVESTPSGVQTLLTSLPKKLLSLYVTFSRPDGTQSSQISTLRRQQAFEKLATGIPELASLRKLHLEVWSFEWETFLRRLPPGALLQMQVKGISVSNLMLASADCRIVKLDYGEQVDERQETLEDFAFRYLANATLSLRNTELTRHVKRVLQINRPYDLLRLFKSVMLPWPANRVSLAELAFVLGLYQENQLVNYLRGAAWHLGIQICVISCHRKQKPELGRPRWSESIPMDLAVILFEEVSSMRTTLALKTTLYSSFKTGYDVALRVMQGRDARYQSRQQSQSQKSARNASARNHQTSFSFVGAEPNGYT